MYESMESPSQRNEFMTYWQAALKRFGPGKEGMMLNENASDGVDTGDRDDVMKLMSNHIDKRLDIILEIGAGIGRFTNELQNVCDKIIAIDFVDEFIQNNKKMNTKPNRVDEFIVGDATILKYPKNSFDMVFWNWLLMYLKDDEVTSFIERVADWVKVGGYIFCRESCGEPSTKSADRVWAPEGNPTQYRPCGFYDNLFGQLLVDQNGRRYEMLERNVSVMTYIKVHNTDGQKCWLLKRIS